MPAKTLLLTTGLALLAGSAIAAPESAGLRDAVETYRTCATLALPDNFSAVDDPRRAAEAALDRCRKQRLALAGQFALENPGTRKTAEYVDGMRQRLVNDLATWVRDMKTLGVQVGIQERR